MGDTMGYVKAKEGLKKLRWDRFRLTYQAEREVSLHAYEGSTLRVPFGHAFHRMFCVRTEYPSGAKCPLMGAHHWTFAFHCFLISDDLLRNEINGRSKETLGGEGFCNYKSS
ncbi:MAG: hypothetical protein ACPLOU_07495 [bacterium]